MTVMVITAVGLLFGAGALLMFRYQCQMRIDRQHELEKVYAVRSALNFIRTYGGPIGDVGKQFSYHTGSDRDLRLIAKPVEAIFPVANNLSHFNMDEKGQFQIPYIKNYNSKRDYEYGASFTVSDWNSELSAFDLTGSMPCMSFINSRTNDNVRWWVNIGMRGTGGWLQEDYGRRYYFQPLSYVGDVGYTKDIIRLCIIRNVTNELNKVGSRHGWPLSQNGERALVFQIWPKEGAAAGSAVENNNTEMSLLEYAFIGGSVVAKQILCITNVPSLWRSGLQIAGDKVSMFYIDNKAGGDTSKTGAYFFSDCKSMTKETYDYFSKEVFVGGKTYGGIYTNDVDGKVWAPELRAVFEVEAASSMRNGETLSEPHRDALNAFRVTPAYQYEILIEHPSTVTNRATIAQKTGGYGRDKNTGKLAVYNNSMITYDTHGTEHKGFRQDERELERSGRK